MSSSLYYKNSKLCFMSSMLSERIKYILREQSASKADLARTAGVSSAAAGLWANGITKEISGEPAIRIANKYGYRLEWLIKGKGPIHTRNESNLKEPIHAYEIQSWEDEDELDSGKAMIPVYDVSLSAGDGAIAPEFVETKRRLAFERNWIKSKGLSEPHLKLMSVRGDSMLPVLGSGDIVLVDLSKRDIIDGKIFAIVVGNDVKIKRLKRKYDGSIIVMSDNPLPQFSDEIIPPDAVEYVYIIGQAVHRAGDL